MVAPRSMGSAGGAGSAGLVTLLARQTLVEPGTGVGSIRATSVGGNKRIRIGSLCQHKHHSNGQNDGRRFIRVGTTACPPYSAETLANRQPVCVAQYGKGANGHNNYLYCSKKAICSGLILLPATPATIRTNTVGLIGGGRKIIVRAAINWRSFTTLTLRDFSYNI